MSECANCHNMTHEDREDTVYLCSRHAATDELIKALAAIKARLDGNPLAPILGVEAKKFKGDRLADIRAITEDALHKAARA